MAITRYQHSVATCVAAAVVWLLLAMSPGVSAQEPNLPGRVKQLEEQNEALRRQMQEQQALIKQLSDRLAGIERRSESKPQADASGPNENTGGKPGSIHIGGEGAAGFFKGGSQTAFKAGDFKVDDARLHLEAPLWQDTYFFSELYLTSREHITEEVFLGELYADFENVSRWFDRDGWLGIRVGRFNIPFGEEYQSRYPTRNPLISHSLSDLWGIDEGIELYGTVEGIRYVLAAQNGGHPMLHDYTSDKAVVARVSYDPTAWLHLSGSAMRTGALNANDKFSELWFGNGFFARFPGSNAATFEADLAELDARIQ